MRDWLVAIRKSKNLSQYDVAREAGISQSYYAAIETEMRGNPLKVDIEEIKKIKILETIKNGSTIKTY